MKNKLKIYYVEYDDGYCGLRAYTNIDVCKKNEKLDHGRLHVRLVRKATQFDIDHVRKMGGYVPKV